MIGENTGTDDFARRARVRGQCNRSEYVLQAGERIAGAALIPCARSFFFASFRAGFFELSLVAVGMRETVLRRTW
jgi:hypothetical protein